MFLSSGWYRIRPDYTTRPACWQGEPVDKRGKKKLLYYVYMIKQAGSGGGERRCPLILSAKCPCAGRSCGAPSCSRRWSACWWGWSCSLCPTPTSAPPPSARWNSTCSRCPPRSRPTSTPARSLLNWASTDSTLRRYLTVGQMNGLLTTSAYETFSDRYLSSRLQTRIVRFFVTQRGENRFLQQGSLTSSAGLNADTVALFDGPENTLTFAEDPLLPQPPDLPCPAARRSAPTAKHPTPAGSIWGWTQRSSPARPTATIMPDGGVLYWRMGGADLAAGRPPPHPAGKRPGPRALRRLGHGQRLPPTSPASPATAAPSSGWGCRCRAGTPS